MYIVALYFKFYLLPLCAPGDLVILDGASYWKYAHALPRLLASPTPVVLRSCDRRGSAQAQPLLRPIFRAAQVNVLYLPPRSPTLNPIEKLWGWMKCTCRA